MSKHTSPLDRRTALQTITGSTLATLTGCLNQGTTPDEGSDNPPTSSAFERVSVEEMAIVIELESSSAVDQINLIRPDDEPFAQKEVPAGSEQIAFDIGEGYEPGEYDVLALREDERVGETPIAVEPDVEVVEMGLGRNQPNEMWTGSESEIRDEAFVTLKNRGTGPEWVTKLLFLGDVPYPSDEDGTNYADDEDISGIYDPDTDSEVDEVSIQPGAQVTIYSSRSPFAFVPGAGTSCEEEQQTGEFDLILETSVSSENISRTYSIQYSASSGEDSCEITISEE